MLHLPFEIRLICLSQAASPIAFTRSVHRASQRFAPTSKDVSSDDSLPGLRLLMRGGFVRQSSAGVFSLLPNGERVQRKIEAIVEDEMHKIGAAKLQLPNLLTSGLWQKSGRWQSTGAELFRFKDRKDSQMLLGPTHEEEMTSLVAQDVTSYKQLPVKVFQITRKFRDEARPRAGLLRGREFTMKDMYTFDEDEAKAKESYLAAKQAYDRIFQRIGVPYHSAAADSGNIGGELSHEYLYKSQAGEDTLVTCSKCDYAANLEVAQYTAESTINREDVQAACFSNDDGDIHILLYPRDRALNTTKVARVSNAGTKHLDPGKLATALSDMASCTIHMDENCEIQMKDVKWVLSNFFDEVLDEENAKKAHRNPMIWTTVPDLADLCEAQAGDKCQDCDGPLELATAIEVGHIFYLGTRYSEPLEATFVPRGHNQSKVPFRMGCYGIGISRLLGAIAEICTDAKGIAWPASVSPYTIAVIPTNDTIMKSHEVIDQLERAFGEGEVLIDDRPDITFGKKMKDAELVGYSNVIILGKRWLEDGTMELYCRRTDSRHYTKSVEELKGLIDR